MTLEVDDDAGRDARAVGVAAGRVEADIVNLGPEGQVRENRKIHAPAEAPGKLAVGPATAANRYARAADQGLCEGRQLARVTQGKSRAEQIRVRIHGNTGRGRVVATEIAHQTKPSVGVIGDRAADAILVESTGAAQAEIGVADGSVDGLGARRNTDKG